MKTVIVRAAVLALVAVGFSAASASTKNVTTASAQVRKMGPPTPQCPPFTGQTCGID
jgi:hypothetical protein